MDAGSIGSMGNNYMNQTMQMGSSLLTSLGSLYANAQTLKFNRKEAAKQREWNENMYDKQNAWNYDMWMKENEYNSPVSQVQRMREAGLNPLYYGLDGSSAGDLTAAQPLGYERASVGALQNPFANLDSVAMKIAQLSNIQADTAKKNNENLTETQRRENMLAENAVLKQTLYNKLAEEGLTKAQRDNVLKGIEWADRINSAIVAEKESSAKLNESQKNRIDELLDGEKLLQSKSIEDFDKKWSKISAEIKKLSKESDLLEQDVINYAVNHLSNGFMGTGLSLQNLIRGLIFGFDTPKKSDDVRSGVYEDGSLNNTD